MSYYLKSFIILVVGVRRKNKKKIDAFGVSLKHRNTRRYGIPSQEGALSKLLAPQASYSGDKKRKDINDDIRTEP
jgi:hypothetical protein